MAVRDDRSDVKQTTGPKISHLPKANPYPLVSIKDILTGIMNTEVVYIAGSRR